MKQFKKMFNKTKKGIDLERMTDPYDDQEILNMIQDASFDLLIGSLALAGGTAALAWVWDTTSKNIAIYGVGFMCLIVGIYCILEAIRLGNE